MGHVKKVFVQINFLPFPFLRKGFQIQNTCCSFILGIYSLVKVFIVAHV